MAHIVREGNAALNEFRRIDTALADAVNRLDGISDSARLDAELLLARALDVPRSYLFAHPDDELDSAAIERYSYAIDRRADGVPLAYITGDKEFWSMVLHVTPATLIPRPETELTVELALARIPRHANHRILDLGTGSGAIALAIASERPLCNVVAVDVSEDALTTARANAARHNLPNVEFLHGSWFEPVAGQHFELIVSNPPYVPSADPDLHRLRHEPLSALASGKDGLDAIRIIAANAAGFLVAGGSLLLEHGDRQHEQVAAVLAQSGWSDIVLAKDLAGKPRVTSATCG